MAQFIAGKLVQCGTDANKRKCRRDINSEGATERELGKFSDSLSEKLAIIIRLRLSEANKMKSSNANSAGLFTYVVCQFYPVA